MSTCVNLNRTYSLNILCKLCHLINVSCWGLGILTQLKNVSCLCQFYSWILMSWQDMNPTHASTNCQPSLSPILPSSFGGPRGPHSMDHQVQWNFLSSPRWPHHAIPCPNACKSLHHPIQSWKHVIVWRVWLMYILRTYINNIF